MKQPQIVLIGHVCIDTNTSEHASYVGWGSSVLYMSQYYRRQRKLEATVITSYGSDMLEYLPEVRLMPARPNRPDTLHFQNDSSKGKRTQRCSNVAASTPPELTPEMHDALRAADIVIVATLLPNYTAEYLSAVLALAPKTSLKVLCPQGYFRNVLADESIAPMEFAEAAAIVPLFDLVIYSEEDHPKAFELARAWSNIANAPVVVTQSDHGATLVQADGTELLVPTTPIPPEDVVDSVGCGDTFAATLAIEHYLHNDIVSAIKAAHHTAADKLRAVITVTS